MLQSVCTGVRPSGRDLLHGRGRRQQRSARPVGADCAWTQGPQHGHEACSGCVSHGYHSDLCESGRDPPIECLTSPTFGSMLTPAEHACACSAEGLAIAFRRASEVCIELTLKRHCGMSTIACTLPFDHDTSAQRRRCSVNKTRRNASSMCLWRSLAIDTSQSNPQDCNLTHGVQATLFPAHEGSGNTRVHAAGHCCKGTASTAS